MKRANKFFENFRHDFYLKFFFPIRKNYDVRMYANARHFAMVCEQEMQSKLIFRVITSQ